MHTALSQVYRRRLLREVKPPALAVVSLAMLLILPMAALFLSFFSPTSDAWQHLLTTQVPGYARQSLQLVLLVALLAGSMGAVSAWLVTQYEFFGRRQLEWLLVLPLAAPAYVIAYAYTDFFQTSGPFQAWLRDLTGWQVREYWFPELRSLPGAALMLACTLYPYVYLLCRAAFTAQSRSLSDTARVFGLTRWQAFVRVSLPLARPALAGGLALVVMETLADYGTVSYFAVQTFTTGIFRAWHAFGDLTAAARLASMLLLLVLAMYTIEQRARRNARYFAHRDGDSPQRQRLRGSANVGAAIACSLPVLLGFTLPLLLLLRLAVGASGSEEGVPPWQRVATAAGNSVSLAAATALIALALATVFGYAARSRLAPWLVPIKRIATLGYAVPGAVIAIGILAPLAWVERSFGGSQLVLSGTVAVLIYAYVVRFLAVAQESLDAGIASVTPSMDDAARSLGLSLLARLWRVHLPLVRQSAMAALLLVFIDVMKELPATLVLRPFNFETLAVQIYNFAADERLNEAALGSITLISLGLLPVAVMARGITLKSQR